MGLGYLSARIRLLEEAGIRGISAFVFNLAIPVMLFRTIAVTELPPEIPWTYLLAFYLSAFVLFAVAIPMGRILYAQRGSEAAIFAMGASYSNVVLLGIPLIMTTFGDAASLPLMLIVATHAALLFFVTTATAELLRGEHARLRDLPLQTLRVLFANPIVIGLIAGLAFNLLDLTIPAPLESLARSLGAAAMPCAVFSVGASLSFYPVRGAIREAVTLVLLKNLAHPLLVWTLATQLFELSPLWAAVATLLAGAPVGVNTYLFAQRYEALVTPTAAAIAISTGSSVVTLTAILYLLGVR